MSFCGPVIEEGIAFVLLAAGRSERFGGDKLVAPFKGRPLWQWAVDAAEEAGFVERYFVVGPHSSLEAPAGWQEVVSLDAAQGMGRSIAAGVRAASHHHRVVIGLADMPMVTAEHLRRVASGTGTSFTRQKDGKPGCPAAFGPESFEKLIALKGDRGARSLDLQDFAVIEPENPGVLFDVDTREDIRI
ncbi:NTP transferase domain-containing protein [Erythrobacter sp. HKB08]|uniref:nucleotidyltransferase family protein n=1 Tax=Erythrobacter sp. HKB08 TaxID=2502843 RepID=UPI00100924B0|nr:nucleotidyltransferase family protein [Erythrobacter sp. HKB08]